VFSTPGARAHKARVLEDMRAVRPVVETGYENVVQVRLLLEGTPVDYMLARWRCVVPWGACRMAPMHVAGDCAVL
jgi:hypothetical protein